MRYIFYKNRPQAVLESSFNLKNYIFIQKKSSSIQPCDFDNKTIYI